MRDDRLRQPRREPLTAVLLEDEHIGEVRKGGAIGDQPSEANLRVTAKDAEWHRVLHRGPHRLEWDAWRPIRPREKPVDDAEVLALGVGADGEVTSVPFHACQMIS